MIRLTPTRRPTGTLRIDRSNPLTTGLIDVFVAGETINLVSGLKLVDSGAGSFIRTSSAGLSKYGNSAHFANQSAAPAGLRVDEITLLALTAPATINSATKSIYGFGNSGVDTPLAFIGQSGSSGKVYFFVRSSAGVTQMPDATPSAAWANLVPNVLVGVRSQAGNFHAFYQNGNQIATTTATTLGATTLNTTSVNGLLRTSAGLSYAGDTAICLAWNRALSPAEIRRISENPWQIFEGFTLYVKTADGGTDYPVTRTESANASDTASIVIGYAATASEIADATSAHAAAMAAAVSIAETGEATSTQAGVLTAFVSIAETGAATDSASTAGLYGVTVAEASDAAGVASAIRALFVTASETGTATDTSSASLPGLYSVTVVEAANAEDAAAQAMSALVVIAEAIAAADVANWVGAVIYTRAPRGSGYPATVPTTERYGMTNTKRPAMTNTRR